MPSCSERKLVSFDVATKGRPALDKSVLHKCNLGGALSGVSANVQGVLTWRYNPASISVEQTVGRFIPHR